MQEPQIRFKGFTDDWKLDKLGNTITFISGNDGQYTNIPILTISAKNRWMKQSDRFSKVIAGKELKRYTLLKRGELSYNHGNSKASKYGAVFELKEYSKALVPKVYHSFKVHSFMNAAFIDYLFTSKIPDRELRKLVSSGARMDGLLNINKHDFASILIRFPKKNEQSKIGRFFNRFDKLIELQSSKLKHLKRLKKSYLQKMFTNGDDVPRLRFKEFSDVWKSKRLKDVGKIVGGGTPSTSNKEYWGGDINWYSPNEITDLPFSYNSNRKITTAGLKHSSAKIHPINTILFTSRAGIGKMTIIKKKATTNQGFQSIEPNKDIDPYFIYSMQNDLKKKAISLASGSTFLEISKKSMGKIKIMIPLKIEQKKLGLFFNKLDKLIELQTSKLEHLKQEKKAYLQKMFI